MEETVLTIDEIRDGLSILGQHPNKTAVREGGPGFFTVGWNIDQLTKYQTPKFPGDETWLEVDFNLEQFKIHGCLISGHNGDPYGFSFLCIPFHEVKKLSDHVLRGLVNLEDDAIKKREAELADERARFRKMGLLKLALEKLGRTSG